jgi:hypothetical protein
VIRASFLKKKCCQITITIPHSCSPTIHYKNKQSSALWFLKDHHRSAVIDNRDITLAQIQSDERLRFGNKISYRQTHHLKEALLAEIESDYRISSGVHEYVCLHERGGKVCNPLTVSQLWKTSDLCTSELCA